MARPALVLALLGLAARASADFLSDWKAASGAAVNLAGNSSSLEAGLTAATMSMAADDSGAYTVSWSSTVNASILFTGAYVVTGSILGFQVRCPAAEAAAAGGGGRRAPPARRPPHF